MRIIDDAWVHETYEELGASSCMKIVTCVVFVASERGNGFAQIKWTK